MHVSRNKWVIVVGAALAAAALACATPGGQPTQAVVQPTAAQPQPTFTPYVVTATAGAAAQPPTAEQPTAQPTLAGACETVKAGVTTQFFVPYTICVPPDWVHGQVKNATGPTSTLTLSKDTYSIVIKQMAAGAGPCTFDSTPVEMAQVFAVGVGITGASAQFMRGTNDGGLNWTVCEKGPDTFGFPTSFGYMTYTLPNPADPATVAEMDGMVASLTH